MNYGWEDTVHYGVSAYSFLILGKETTGIKFVEEIEKHYDANNPRTKAVLLALKRHLDTINVRRDGQTTYTVK